MNLLVIEDNALFGQSLEKGLHEAGHVVSLHVNAASGIAFARANAQDMVLLDLGLPDADGLEVLAALRVERAGLPIIVLTARDAVESRVAALDAGADDYMIKPFAFAELLARVVALHRRAVAPRWPSAPSSDIQLRDDFSIAIAGHEIQLLPRQFALLSYLLSRRNEVVPRGEILRNVLGYEFDPGTNVIDVHLTHLRRRLAATPIKIETIRGVGLRLEIAS
jgi:DNA-binding response OmpR family regulator